MDKDGDHSKHTADSCMRCLRFALNRCPTMFSTSAARACQYYCSRTTSVKNLTPIRT